jgi:hypothetical protein
MHVIILRGGTIRCLYDNRWIWQSSVIRGLSASVVWSPTTMVGGERI